MKDTIEIALFSLFGPWLLLIPAIMVMKIKYFKTSRQKEFRGTIELFSFLSSEWWYAGLTWAIPTIGRDKNDALNEIRARVNSRLYLFYLIILIQLILVAVLNKIG